MAPRGRVKYIEGMPAAAGNEIVSKTAANMGANNKSPKKTGPHGIRNSRRFFIVFSVLESGFSTV
jgi:hypothetical protein